MSIFTDEIVKVFTCAVFLKNNTKTKKINTVQMYRVLTALCQIVLVRIFTQLFQVYIAHVFGIIKLPKRVFYFVSVSSVNQQLCI